MTDIEVTAEHREAAEEIHDQIDDPDSTEAMSVDETAERFAKLRSEFHVPADEAEKSIRRLINQTEPVSSEDDEDEADDQSPPNIEREDCVNCGGTGELTKMVAGRSGIVACDQCDNIPESAVPDDPPADPEARIEELEAKKQDVMRSIDEMEALQEKITTVRTLLREIGDSEYVDDENEIILSHIESQVRNVTEGVVMPHLRRQEIDHLDKKIQDVRRYQEALKEQNSEGETA